MTKTKLHLFEAFGIELEYMLVQGETLAVLPVADKVMASESGRYGDIERGKVAWSNEFVLHVLEMKTNGPTSNLLEAVGAFQKDVRHLNSLLIEQQGRLMPTGMHPLMDPARETQLWPHEGAEIYQAFDKLFNCKGHGWSNLQSCHLNLPFADDAEFAKLHTAIRVILPLIPALAASSPIVEGRVQTCLDNRLRFYQDNAIRYPRVTGMVIPEAAMSRKDYEINVLAPIYHDIAEDDPDGILQHEWINSRGAIARFDRSSIEIRLLDVQECPEADIAICALLVDILKALVEERLSSHADQKILATAKLAQVFRRALVDGRSAVITEEPFLRALAFPGNQATAGELWQHLRDKVWTGPSSAPEPFQKAIQSILEVGNLSERILKALGRDTSRQNIRTIYAELCRSLATGQMFLPT